MSPKKVSGNPKSKKWINAIWKFAEGHANQCAIEHGFADQNDHGPAHWYAVYHNGMALAKAHEADEVIISLFACLHDCCRQTNHTDQWHGHRAAGLALRLYEGGALMIFPFQFDALWNALAYHHLGRTEPNCLTIGSCWDADRLDLPRVGMRVEQKYISTEAGWEMACDHLAKRKLQDRG